MNTSKEEKCIIVNGNIKLVWGGFTSYDYSWIIIYQLSNNEWVESDRIERISHKYMYSIHVNNVTIYISDENCLATIELVNNYYKIITYKRGETTPKYGTLFRDFKDENNFITNYHSYDKMLDNLLKLTNR